MSQDVQTTQDREEGIQASATDDAAIISECLDRFRISVAADGENRRDGLDDLAFLKGDQWDERIKQARALDGRPCLTINKLPTSLHQITNSQRQNIPSIKVHPTAEGADQKIAEIVQGGIRHIEYKSKADVAKDTAVNSAAAIGYGYFRLATQYKAEDSFDQEIAFKRIRNPFTVYMDPGSIEVDGSDQQWCILSEKMKRSEFRLMYPDADPCGMNGLSGLGDRGLDWISTDEVRVAEYYRIYREPATAVLLTNGESGWKDKLLALPPGVTIQAERKSTRSVVQWFKLSATAILERAEIPCKWIPVFPVYGDEIDLDGKVYRRGMIRDAKDPARMYNYWMTAATEEIGLRPKAPYIGAEGQFEGHEEKWRNANVRNYSYLEYKPKSLGGQLAPPPQRQQMADVPTGVLAMAQHASDDIKATTGIFDASLGARSNETSGRAINARDRQGETANYHYMDNLNTTLRHVGRCILDMWPKIYDGTRMLEIMGMDGKVNAVKINEPSQEQSETGQAIEKILNDMSSVADYSVTISVGPSYDTMRQEAVDGMIQTAQAWPKLMDVAGDKVVRSMDWPGADQIADRIAKTIPMELMTDEDKQAAGGEQTVQTPMGPVPVSQVPAMLGQMQQQLQQMTQALQDAESGLAKAQLDAESRERVAAMNNQAKLDVTELKGMVDMLLAKMTPPPVLVDAAMTTGGTNTGMPVDTAQPGQEMPQ